MLGVWGEVWGMPPRKILNFLFFTHLRWHSRPFWAKLATNIDPAIAMHIANYVLTV